MRIRLAPRRKFIILLLLTLALSAATAGIYLLVSDDTSIPYTVDKYSDALDWCEPSTENGELKIDCKALLLSIKNQEDNSTCFDVQVISNAKELKDLTVCEKVDTLTYTSEVASYKILMPVDIVFTYTKGLLNNFSFKNVSFTSLDDTYVQNIVNEDITNLVTTTIDHEVLKVKIKDTNTEMYGVDSSTYTVQNSVDFCPSKNLLPSYVMDNNRNTYTNFYDSNISKASDLSTAEAFNGDLVIRKLFICNGANLLNYKTCQNVSTKSLPSKPKAITSVNISFGYNLNTDEAMYLKLASLIYDNLQIKESPDANTIAKIDMLTNYINSTNAVNESTMCASYLLYNLLSKKDSIYKDNAQIIYDAINVSFSHVTSSLCTEILYEKGNLSVSGLYLKTYFSELQDSSILRIYNRCNNLRLFMK